MVAAVEPGGGAARSAGGRRGEAEAREGGGGQPEVTGPAGGAMGQRRAPVGQDLTARHRALAPE